MNFDKAFETLIGHEGGYVNNPNDPGGETKYGISKRSFPGEDIKNLSLDRAKMIYLHEFWGPAGCDAVPPSLKLPLFDFAVNSGVSVAIKALQTCVHETPDGIIGPKTLAAINAFPSNALVINFLAQRLIFMTSLAKWEFFSKGWARRIANNLQTATKEFE